MNLFSSFYDIDTIEKATDRLENILFYSMSPKIRSALNFCVVAHNGQVRKSGIPYAIHPILVSCIVAYYGGEESMICAALLHDVVEDTDYNIDWVRDEFGDDVASLVDSLTKIVDIRKEEFPSDTNEKLASSALSFRKMLVASIKDVRALVIKISDRLHNMLTLDVLPEHKQRRIAEETLVVYAPIAHRLGISSIKNELEDRSFYYIFRDEYNKIGAYLDEHRQNLILKLNNFTTKISSLLMQGGFLDSDFRIESRIKRPYSIFLKIQKKGVSIDEILDLLAIRIIVNDDIDCYKALGLVHLYFKPLISRFKDYIALPKENGYQTIHTTVFDESSIFEIQIRTTKMHHSAEFGVAAHWKYKNIGMSPSTDWISNLQYQDNNIEEFYELAKNDLYREDIVVFSPAGDTYTLPVGAVALDFAYAVHTKLGSHAKEAYINHQKASLLTTLKSGDIVRIITGESSAPKCTWIDTVKTSKAKSDLKIQCSHKIKEIEQKSAINIISTIFFDHNMNIVENFVKENNLLQSIGKATKDLDFLIDLKNRIKNQLKNNVNFLSKIRLDRLKIKKQEFGNLIVYSNHTISETLFDYCCRPKHNDEVLAIKNGSKVFIHHKLCERVFLEVSNGARMVFVHWKDDVNTAYKVIVALEGKKGTLAEFLGTLMKYDCNVIGVSYNGYKNQFMTNCEIMFETPIHDTKILKNMLLKKYKIIDFFNLKDAYT
ncbi:bifunctional (p)ppGpp synthetase/guanosine-3',5'-bis(diphosphate) 3'-pyrophosphohydrolase [Helicobacter sp. MIT 99-5507]|uniref:RelA/SpoT family protein n=1 Tax=Helicobacter sp. MIT 99-5507 TaxID=152489 RepID=UPI000E1EA6A4|nr:RelA/SpoT family protein [Helicobacter sp. MIT 99-5507]RDU57519.1 penta-phosphate guanosine-3'-pyrophosphohydrolase [Helicobacter sp. MIT 99-5507]